MKLPYVVMVCRPPGRCRGRREQCRSIADVCPDYYFGSEVKKKKYKLRFLYEYCVKLQV